MNQEYEKIKNNVISPSEITDSTSIAHRLLGEVDVALDTIEGVVLQVRQMKVDAIKAIDNGSLTYESFYADHIFKIGSLLGDIGERITEALRNASGGE